jgi:hypothetical protein
MHHNNVSVETDSAVRLLHCMDVGSVASVSEIHTASSSRAEYWVGELLCVHGFCFERTWGGGGGACSQFRPVEMMDGESCETAELTSTVNHCESLK